MILPNPVRSASSARIAGAIVLALVAGGSPGRAGGSSPLAFAWEMAKGGNWREAKYRWELALKTDPDNRRLLNNLAVAQEALGQPEEARSAYARALAASASASDPSIEDNRRRSEQFWASLSPAGALATTAASPSPSPSPGKPGGKAAKVTVELPVPPRIDMAGMRDVLVTRFITEETPLLDTDREIVHFVRDELRKSAELDVLPVSPAPAVPEQTLDELAANREFWKRLGQQHHADLIVSGAVRFERRDSSGFRDVDSVSAVTGQKVREARFVEQERFAFELDVLFVNGATGELLLRDHLSRSAVIAGTHNDPITAFFELGDSLAPDITAIIHGCKRQETRYVFKR